MVRLPLLTDAEIEAALALLPGWKVEERSLTKTFRFPSFMAGIDFVREVAQIAEEMNHHPDIAIRFHLLTFTLTTHGSKGLTENDVLLAQKIEAAVEEKAKS